ncbi:MAG: GHKL domain-containing protein [Bacteroidetes bacterium]|nr:MAG: GHKL domain-containing protein [Bacteroidota bacterium]
MKARHIFIGLFMLLSAALQAQYVNVLQDADNYIRIKNKCQYLEDPGNNLSFDEVKGMSFKEIPNKDVPNFGITSSTIWIKLHVQNQSDVDELILEVSQPILDELELFDSTESGLRVLRAGEYFKFDDRYYDDPNYLFPVQIAPQEGKDLYLKIRSKENLQVPILVGSRQSILEINKRRDIFSGLYLGIMLVMLLYNAFIFFSTRDKSYAYYVLYLFCVILTQSSIQGYSFQYLWPNWPALARYNSFIFPVLVGISGMQFMRVFLDVRHHVKFFDKVFIITSIAYVIGAGLAFIGYYDISFYAIEVTAIIVSASMMISAVRIARQGYRPATWFAIAWSVFLIGIGIYVMKDMGILPYTPLTYYMMPIGSAIEVMLLSFALADRINILKKEKEASQAEALRVSLENEQIIREQNVNLERKVKERTLELEETNEELVVTLNHLKETQAQLVEAEKMASLGQLTAGIAHEINNPINFVSANVEPLRLDIQDILEVVQRYEDVAKSEEGDKEAKLKEVLAFKEQLDYNYIQTEIKQLLKGIAEGAERTAEIVKGLKTFSRLDESDLKPADINEGIQSTLVILRNSIPDHVELVTDYGELPMVECFPGKVNQVFMNILNNALQAMQPRKEGHKDQLKVKTTADDLYVYVSIADTGPGMPDSVRSRIFEPFYTTKEVGEGTGLGLSIVFKIVETHGGKIQVNTELGKGTEFLVTLPIVAQINAED